MLDTLSVDAGAICWCYEGSWLRIEAHGPDSLRVRASIYPDRGASPNALLPPGAAEPVIVQEGASLRITNGRISATVDLQGRIVFRDSKGEVLLEEKWRQRDTTTKFWTVGLDEVHSISALSIAGREFKPLHGGTSRIAVRFEAKPGERLHGMGQYQQPNLDLAGCSLDLAQRNSQASVPFVLSSHGYGLLWNNPAVGEASFAANGMRRTAEGAREIDYWITADDTPAAIVRNYAAATAAALAGRNSRTSTAARWHRRRGHPRCSARATHPTSTGSPSLRRRAARSEPSKGRKEMTEGMASSTITSMSRPSRNAGGRMGISADRVQDGEGCLTPSLASPQRARRASLLGTCVGIAALGATQAVAQAVPVQQPAAGAVQGSAATSGADGSEPNVADIVVTGRRLGFSTTSEIKRDAPQSVSVLTSTDLRNIPDTILIDIVRRVPGLQVSQGGGGGIVSIRGLSQVEERMNGRNFPSAISRTFDVATLPGDLVSGVAVYKTPTADQVEGGIAGIIDFRTRRPFDFEGFAGSVTAKGVYTNLDKKVDPVLSGYVSNKWDVGGGQFGILLGGSFQRQRNALHLLYTDGNKVQTNAGGTAIDAPTAVYKRYFVNTKNVSTGYGALQWRSGGGLEMSVDLLYNDSRNAGGLQSLISHFDQGTPTGPFALYDGSKVFKSGSYRNVPLESATNRFRGDLDALQAGYNVTYTKDRLTLSGDVAYTKSNNSNSGGALSLTTTAPGIAYDTDKRFPDFAVSGVDPKALSAYRYSAYSEYLGKDVGTDVAARGDATYRFDGVLRSIQAGVRYDRRTVLHTGGSTSAATIPATIGSPVGNPLAELTADNLYRSNGVEQRQWASIGYGALGSHISTSRALFGTGAPVNDPAQRYNGAEKTLSGYAMAAYAFPLLGLPVDGNVGVRVVKTKVGLDANRSIRGVLSPESSDNSYTDVLPSVNVRLTLAKELFLRLSYSKQVSRPTFGQLAPVTVIDAAGLTGSSGNPELKPLRANQFDASLEHYFGADNSIYVAGFYKDVTGFVRNNVSIETIAGQSYRITRPQNLSSGYIAGGEIGYRQTFSFLPGALSGLGIQGSYTYVRGSRSANPAGYVVPYEQITRHNYQLSGFYSKYGISANVNWVWRSRLLEASSGDVSGRPDYRIPFGQLDANLIYALTPKVNVILSGVNLTQSLIRRSYQDTRFFGQDALENRRILGGIQVKLGGGI